MDLTEALSFLREHQPMPPDTELSEADIVRYDEVRRFCQDHPDPECIPLFLNSFGDGSGFGVYQLVDTLIAQFTPEEVLPHLLKALASPYRSVRYWSAQIAAHFPSSQLIKPLEHLMTDPDYDCRSAAATALFFIKDKAIVPVLETALQNESDEDLHGEIASMLAELRERE